MFKYVFEHRLLILLCADPDVEMLGYRVTLRITFLGQPTKNTFRERSSRGKESGELSLTIALVFAQYCGCTKCPQNCTLKCLILCSINLISSVWFFFNRRRMAHALDFVIMSQSCPPGKGWGQRQERRQEGPLVWRPRDGVWPRVPQPGAVRMAL